MPLTKTKTKGAIPDLHTYGPLLHTYYNWYTIVMTVTNGPHCAGVCT